MKVVVVGATGGVGRLLVEQGLAGGHHLVAVARRPSGFDSSVRTFSADLATAVSADLVPAFDGADVVLSALGPRNRRDAGITAIGTRIILEAMAAASIRRIVMTAHHRSAPS